MVLVCFSVPVVKVDSVELVSGLFQVFFDFASGFTQLEHVSVLFCLSPDGTLWLSCEGGWLINRQSRSGLSIWFCFRMPFSKLLQENADAGGLSCLSFRMFPLHCGSEDFHIVTYTSRSNLWPYLKIKM